MLEIIVKDQDNSIKLYKFLFVYFAKTISIANWQKLIRTKRIKVNNCSVTYDYCVVNGDVVSIFKSDIEECKKKSTTAKKPLVKNIGYIYAKQIQKIKQTIIYEDNDLMVFNKPTGLAVQGGSKVNFSLNCAFPFINSNLQIVHRIDKETSGIILTAKNTIIATYLHSLFKTRKVNKTYLCLVTPYNSLRQGTLRTFLSSTGNQKEITVINTHEGKEAISEFTTLEIANNVGLLQFSPLTGRKHQIRAQAAYLLHAPIVGDYKYGYKPTSLTKNLPKRIYLHAYNISFSMPNGEVINLTAALDANFQEALKKLNIGKNFCTTSS